MSFGFKIYNDQNPHFVTCTTVLWIDLFHFPEAQNIVIEDISFYAKKYNILIHAWVIMSNHLHLIISGTQIPKFIQCLKRHSNRSLLELLKEIGNSRSSLYQKIIANRTVGRASTRNQVWQTGYHPIELSNEMLYNQRLDYLHENPVEKGLVFEPHEYRLSSAIDYYGGKGLLPIVILE